MYEQTVTEFYKQLYQKEAKEQDQSSNLGYNYYYNNNNNNNNNRVSSLLLLLAETNAAIYILKEARVSDPNGIGDNVLRNFAERLLPLLIIIFDEICSLSQWKETGIIRVYKKGDKFDINNYRPIISLTSNVAKLPKTGTSRF